MLNTTLRKLTSLDCVVYATASSAAWLAAVVLVFQPQLLFADPVPVIGGQSIRVSDVALGNNGVLFGQLLDAQGQQLPIAEIQLTNGVRSWTTYTDNEGNFRVEGLTGATYQVQAAGQMQIVRAWAPGTAPPSASQGLLLVHDSSVVLGQHSSGPIANRIANAKHPLSNPFIFGGIVAAAIAIPVAIHNHNQDEGPATP